MKTKLYLSFFVVIWIAIIAVSFSLISCNITPGLISTERELILCKQVKEKSYIALIEGIQPLSGESMKLLGQKLSISKNISVCATSGNHDSHMPIIRVAFKNHHKIYIAGFSAGEGEAIQLARDCEKEGITVEKLFLLDGVEKGKIPRTVKNAVDIVGTSPYIFRRSLRYSESDLENKNTSIEHFKVSSSHLDVPAKSYSIMLSEF